MGELDRPPIQPTLEEKQQALLEYRNLVTNNKGCTVVTCHGSYAHSGPCCVAINCDKREEDI